MEIKWLGQSCFEIVTANGTRIVTDPFAPNDTVNFPGLEITCPPVDGLEADVVIVSHRGHFDHDNTGAIKGDPVIIDKAGATEAKGMMFNSFGIFHRTGDGFSEEPFNHVFYWEADGLKLCHPGDLGYVLDEDLTAKIKGVDILFIPVGEGFTAPHEEILTIIKNIGPRVVIPMHYKTEEVPFLPKTLDDFLGVCGMEVKYPEAPFTVTKNTLPEKATLYVLKKP